MANPANPFKTLWHQTRGLLGIRRQRKLPAGGPKPRIGAHMVLGDVRITVQAGMSDELWSWLLARGWREPAFRPDRRRYREVPGSWVTRLIDCEPKERAGIVNAAVAKAALRPGAGHARVAPAYAHRK